MQPVRAILMALAIFLLGTLSWAQKETSYILGPEDIVTVTVIDQPKFSGDYFVPESGIIALPVVGEVKVTGKSLTELQRIATAGFKKRLVNPEVFVAIKVPRPRRVYVLGEVQRPGMLEMKNGWRFHEALAAAGGVTAGLAQRDVTVIIEKATGEKTTLSLAEALDGITDPRLKLDTGDVVRLQGVAVLPVYVTGKVKTPGLVRLRDGESGVLQALAQAGGVTDDADLTTVKVIRLSGAEEVVDLSPALVRNESVAQPRLNAGDMVLVSESQTKFAILGYVTRPGYYSIASGQTVTLAQAVAVAGGNEKRGRLSRVGVVRFENGTATRKVYDLGRFLQKGDPAHNPTLVAGDVIYVPETDKVDLLNVLSAIASVNLIFRR